MRYPVTRIFLALSGLIGLIIGIAVLFLPHALFASNHVMLGADPNLLSEIRAPGGFLLMAGATIIYGAIKARLLRMALFLVAAVFGTYGLSRVVSLVVDGAPSSTLMSALALEIVICGVATGLVVKLGADGSDVSSAPSTT